MKQSIIGHILFFSVLLASLMICEPVKAASLKKPTITITSFEENPKITVSKVEGATGYRFYRKTQFDDKWVKLATTKKRTFVDKDWEDYAGTTVKYTVKAYKKSSKTVWSKAATAKAWTLPENDYSPITEIKLIGDNVHNFAITDVDNFLYIRSEPSIYGSITGKLPQNGGCYITEDCGDEWAMIQSNGISGYVQKEYLLTGKKAKEYAKKVCYCEQDIYNPMHEFHRKPSEDSEILGYLGHESEFKVLGVTEDGNWFKVQTSKNVGFIKVGYVELTYYLRSAVPRDVEIKDYCPPIYRLPIGPIMNVPDVFGKESYDAEVILFDLGFHDVGTLREYSYFERGTVIRTIPERGDQVLRSDRIIIVESQGEEPAE